MKYKVIETTNRLDLETIINVWAAKGWRITTGSYVLEVEYHNEYQLQSTYSVIMEKANDDGL